MPRPAAAAAFAPDSGQPETMPLQSSPGGWWSDTPDDIDLPAVDLDEDTDDLDGELPDLDDEDDKL